MHTRIGDETAARIAGAWETILARIAAGALIKDVLAELELKREWVSAYIAREPGRRAEWDDARERSADAFAEEALNVARDPFETVTKDSAGQPLAAPLIVRRDPAHARTYIDTLKWAARTRNPRIYSDKSTVDLNVRTVDLTRIISDANARLEMQRAAGRIIESTIVRQALPAPSSLDDLL